MDLVMRQAQQHRLVGCASISAHPGLLEVRMRPSEGTTDGCREALAARNRSTARPENPDLATTSRAAISRVTDRYSST
jgi:hypothetical protein